MSNSQLVQTPVGVEKLTFRPKQPNSRNLGDRKSLGGPRKSIVGLPDAVLFLRISWERVFQHPRLSLRAFGPRKPMKVA
jgi:hypothetical protein